MVHFAGMTRSRTMVHFSRMARSTDMVQLVLHDSFVFSGSLCDPRLALLQWFNSHSMARSCLGTLFFIDSLTSFGALLLYGLYGSFRPLGSLWANDSFRIFGPRTILDSLGLDGSLFDTDSFRFCGALSFSDSFTRFGSLIYCDSLGLQGPLDAVDSLPSCGPL
jgi:hypothetical protein